MSIVKQIAVECTDRGQHKRTRLATVDLLEDGRRHMKMTTPRGPIRSWGPPGSVNDAGHSRDLYEFICPRCRRSPQLQPDRWWAIVDVTFAAGAPRLDLSNLPL